MSDKLDFRTEKIIKYIIGNSDNISAIFAKLAALKINKKDPEKYGKLMYQKFIKVITDLEFFSKNNDWKNATGLYKDNVLIYRTILYAVRQVELTESEKDITRVLLVYLLCVVKVLKKSFVSTDSTDLENLKGFNIKKTLNECCTSECGTIETPVCGTIDSTLTTIQCSDSCEPSETTICEPSETTTDVDCNWHIIKEKLKSIFNMFNLMKILVVTLDKHYGDQLNQFNMYATTEQISLPDFELTTRLMDIYSSQYGTIITGHCDKLFHDNAVLKTIRVLLKNKKTFDACTIDNFSISKEETEGIISVIFKIGHHDIKVEYLKQINTYEQSIVILSENSEKLKLVYRLIDNNQKIVKECLKSLDKMS
jgi:hypothetical protein